MEEQWSENPYRVILDAINDGVFTVDRQWRITSFNRAAERITGVPRAEAIGKVCCDVFRANICEVACALRETLVTGHPVANRSLYIFNAEGEQVPISISTAVFRDESGEVIGGAETFRDLSEVETLRKELADRYSLADIIGQSRAMRDLFDLLPRIAQSDSSVLIEGASGTGKEMFARAIHDLSPRRDKPMITVNCGALPDTLLESELFGHVAGAFTDAREDRAGRFEAADGGTLFLDEIGEISQAMQVRLLRVLQQKTYEPLGSVATRSVDVRILAATNRPLRELIDQGQFREDLFYRLHVIGLKLPSLRDRREDIPLLVERFVEKFNRLQGKDIVGLSPEALVAISEHDFPGNVRELENAIEHAFALCCGGVIQLEHLPVHLRHASGDDRPGDGAAMSLRSMERVMLRDALRRCHGSRKEAAKQLGINPSTLFRKAKSLGISLPEVDGRSRRGH